MTIIWLLVWYINATPELHQWNGWALGLVACVATDVLGGSQLAGYLDNKSRERR